MTFTIRDFVMNSTGVKLKSDTVMTLNNRGDYALLYCNKKCINVEFSIITGKKNSTYGPMGHKIADGDWVYNTDNVMLGPGMTYEVKNNEDTTGSSRQNVDIKIILTAWNEITERNPETGEIYTTDTMPAGHTPENTMILAGPETGSNITDPDNKNKEGGAWKWVFWSILLISVILIGYAALKWYKPDLSLKDKIMENLPKGGK